MVERSQLTMQCNKHAAYHILSQSIAKLFLKNDKILRQL